MGANFLLGSDSTSVPLGIANTIVILDNHKETKSVSDVFLTRGVSAKVRDLRCGNMRDVLKFYSKRLSCACLKKIYSDARKTLPKVGKCFHCGIVKERALLSVCSKCRIEISIARGSAKLLSGLNMRVVVIDVSVFTNIRQNESADNGAGVLLFSRDDVIHLIAD